ncbi:hypothetical protein QR680_005864 [Steinernema hermaphroditum]|uniref:RBR-type E3 ubiquitin transferase n=1 Tax=Steinernema hermaphroditum TaxID=289476 RepID=A0AA39LW47_9BILA|nr:hypothetical protein QR680_005864 [Steinernema hermaphroditum]
MEVEAADLYEQRGIRCHREQKFFRKRKVACGPDLLSKEYFWDQSFAEAYDYIRTGNPNEDLDASSVPVKDLELDPFAARSFTALYSLNKKKRWLMEKLMAEDAEKYQTDTLRVTCLSIAVPALGSKYHEINQQNYLLQTNVTRGYHTVKKGEEIHKSSKRAHLSGFLHPENPPRHRRGRRLKNPQRRPEDEDEKAAGRSENDTKPHERRFHQAYVVFKKDWTKSCLNSHHDIGKAAVLSDRYSYYLDDLKKAKKVSTKKAERGFWKFHEERECFVDDDECLEEPVAGEARVPSEVPLFDYVVKKKNFHKKRKTKPVKTFEDYRPLADDEEAKIDVFGEEASDAIVDDAIPESTVITVEPLKKIDEFDIDILRITRLPTIPVVFSTTNSTGDIVIIRDDGFFLNPRGEEIVEGDYKQRSVVVEKNILGEMTSVDYENPQVMDASSAEKMALELYIQDTEPSGCTNGKNQDQKPEEECGICLEEGFQMALASCGHFSCVDCWTNYAARSIHDNRVPLRCPGGKCSEVVPIAVMRSFIRQEMVRRYEKLLANRRLLQDDFLFCHRCDKFVFAKKSSARILICECGAAVCRGCREEAHEPLSCENMRKYEDMLKRNGQSFHNSSKAHVANGVKCPKCSGLIDRTEGCNHMTCFCGFEFCYACREPFTGSHYNCESNGRQDFALIDGPETVHPTVFQKCAVLRVKKNSVNIHKMQTKFQKIMTVDKAKELLDRFCQLLDFAERAQVHLFLSYQRVHFKREHFLAHQFTSLEQRLLFILERVEMQTNAQKIEAMLHSALRICDDINKKCRRM